MAEPQSKPHGLRDRQVARAPGPGHVGRLGGHGHGTALQHRDADRRERTATVPRLDRASRAGFKGNDGPLVNRGHGVRPLLLPTAREDGPLGAEALGSGAPPPLARSGLLPGLTLAETQRRVCLCVLCAGLGESGGHRRPRRGWLRSLSQPAVHLRPAFVTDGHRVTAGADLSGLPWLRARCQGRGLPGSRAAGRPERLRLHTETAGEV